MSARVDDRPGILPGWGEIPAGKPSLLGFVFRIALSCWVGRAPLLAGSGGHAYSAFNLRSSSLMLRAALNLPHKGEW